MQIIIDPKYVKVIDYTDCNITINLNHNIKSTTTSEKIAKSIELAMQRAQRRNR